MRHTIFPLLLFVIFFSPLRIIISCAYYASYPSKFSCAIMEDFCFRYDDVAAMIYIAFHSFSFDAKMAKIFSFSLCHRNMFKKFSKLEAKQQKRIFHNIRTMAFGKIAILSQKCHNTDGRVML